LVLVDGLVKAVEGQSDAEGVYRGLVALGTLLGVGEEVRTAAKEVYGLEKVVQGVVGKAADPRIKGVGREIRELLK